MKRQNSALFIRNSLNINILKIKNIVKLEIMVIMQVNIEVLYITYIM